MNTQMVDVDFVVEFLMKAQQSFIAEQLMLRSGQRMTVENAAKFLRGHNRAGLANALEALLSCEQRCCPCPTHNPLWPDWPEGVEFTEVHRVVLRAAATEAGTWPGFGSGFEDGAYQATGQLLHFKLIRHEDAMTHYHATPKGRLLLARLAAAECE